MGPFFLNITVILCIAALFAILFRILRQPLILAYILTGIVVSPFIAQDPSAKELISSFAELGITLLLFMLGLELRISELRTIGKVSILVGLFQMIVVFAAGYVYALFFGFSPLSSIYIGLALCFSSTIIAIKIISDKRDLSSLYGKIAVGVLLFQDFVAILALIILSSFTGSKMVLLGPIFFVLLKGLALFLVVFLLSKSVLPQLFNMFSKSQEMLFLVSIAFALGMAALVSSPLIGFSIEIGGLLAGLSLSNSLAQFQIAARVRALRDFFIIIFFVFLGTKMIFEGLISLLIPAILLSFLVLVFKPLSLMTAMAFLGYRKRTSYLLSIHLAHISEFSLILILLGNKLLHVENAAVSLITIVGVISFIASTYMIMYADKLFRLLHPFFNIFEKEVTHQELVGDLGELKDHVVIVGANRMGKSILDSLEGKGNDIIVVDFDPEIVASLKEKGIQTIFGDISDLDIQERLKLSQARLIVSTVTDLDDNLLLLKGLKDKQSKAKAVVIAEDHDDARELYKQGADYVVLPRLVGGQHVAKILRENHLDTIEQMRTRDMGYLQKK